MSRMTPQTDERMPGPVSLFRKKIRKPVTLTLTEDHHTKVNSAMKRVELTRADTIGVLIELYAPKLRKRDVFKVQRRLDRIAARRRVT